MNLTASGNKLDKLELKKIIGCKETHTIHIAESKLFCKQPDVFSLRMGHGHELLESAKQLWRIVYLRNIFYNRMLYLLIRRNSF